MNITVLYGTETGNTEMLAEDLTAHLEGGHDVACSNLSDFDPADFSPDRLYLVLCSTYGDGELPGSARPFAEALAAKAPDLSTIHVAVFGLGDSEYAETHNFGSRVLLDLLKARGAVEVGERVIHDASGPDMASDVAMPWADDMVARAEARLGEAV